MKLTIKNYKEATKGLAVSKLPEPAQEAHKEFDDFAEFYNEDKDIKEMLDNHFKIVEPFLKKDSGKRFKDLPDRHPLNILDKESGQYKSALKEYQESKKKSKPQAKSPVVKKRTAKKKATTKRTAAKKAKRKPIEVPVMPLEIKIIKRYLNFHGKKVTERQVSLLYKVIQKAATEKTIRKSSTYADEIKTIGNDLAKTYKAMGASCTFEVPSAPRSKLEKLVDNYGVTPAITLIKRFINLYGNISIEKAKRLLTSIKNAKKNGKVTNKDNAYHRVNQVQKHLEEYLESDKLLVTNIQLRGLEGIANMGK